MWLEDEIEGLGIGRGEPGRRRASLRPRILLYAHLFMVLPAIFFGRCEGWGYGWIQEPGLAGHFFELAFAVTGASTLVFPYLVLEGLKRTAPDERWAWAALPVSLAIGFAQFLAMMPLFQ